jgi:hypothetical protein
MDNPAPYQAWLYRTAAALANAGDRMDAWFQIPTSSVTEKGIALLTGTTGYGTGREISLHYDSFKGWSLTECDGACSSALAVGGLALDTWYRIEITNVTSYYVVRIFDAAGTLIGRYDPTMSANNPSGGVGFQLQGSTSSGLQGSTSTTPLHTATLGRIFLHPGLSR